jgi:hypothetical protein
MKTPFFLIPCCFSLCFATEDRPDIPGEPARVSMYGRDIDKPLRELVDDAALRDLIQLWGTVRMTDTSDFRDSDCTAYETVANTSFDLLSRFCNEMRASLMGIPPVCIGDENDLLVDVLYALYELNEKIIKDEIPPVVQEWNIMNIITGLQRHPGNLRTYVDLSGFDFKGSVPNANPDVDIAEVLAEFGEFSKDPEFGSDVDNVELRKLIQNWESVKKTEDCSADLAIANTSFEFILRFCNEMRASLGQIPLKCIGAENDLLNSILYALYERNKLTRK